MVTARPTTKHAPEQQLSTSLRTLNATIIDLPEKYGYVFQPGKHLFITYLKGIVYGLGVLTAVAIVIPILVAMLQQVSWVPIIGDFVKDIATRVEESNVRR